MGVFTNAPVFRPKKKKRKPNTWVTAPRNPKAFIAITLQHQQQIEQLRMINQELLATRAALVAENDRLQKENDYLWSMLKL